MASIDEATAFRRASEGFVDRARKIGPEQWSGPTPCTEWDVRTLVNHVAGEYLWVPEMLAGKTIADVGDRLDGDLLGDDPLQTLMNSGFRAALIDAINTLPEREKILMGLYYEQEMNLKEIGAVMGVSESRVCQIHGQALVRLRARLAEWLTPD